MAGMMIPASEQFGIPGADDAVIFADIIGSIGRDLGEVRAALAQLAGLAGGAFADLDATGAETVAETFHARGGAAATLGRVILQCYYRDDRVLRSVGHEPPPPYPRGRVLDQGDWSLLEAGRGRSNLWRDERSV
jgi:hypothetical protein